MSTLKATLDDIRYAYRLLLGREPDEQGLSTHLKLLEQSDLSSIGLAKGFFGSKEFREKFGCLISVPVGDKPPRSVRLQCQACTREQIESQAFLYWANRLGERPGGLHRKLWEWCFIAQALYERGALRHGKRGLGFAVGTEQLPALFASYGCEILATDLERAEAQTAGWVDTNQHAQDLSQLNSKKICLPADFEKRVKFRTLDMRNIPDDLGGFDFIWSSCAFEHLGSLETGLQFVEKAMVLLRPGGLAVHTTELNCDSDLDTVETGGSVIYRKCDLLGLASRLRANGHSIESFDFNLGDTDADRHVDEPPYMGQPHLKLRLGGYASTSFGIIVTKGYGIP